MSVTSPAERVTARSPGTVYSGSVFFSAAAFLAAFLLFILQPMVGKMILPRFGGVPAVWNTCQLFFQVALLAGYGYAHLSVARLGVRRQARAHLLLLLLPIVSLPISLPAGWDLADDRAPIPTLLGLLVVTAALPFFVISATAPLLQRWYTETGRGAGDPYFLYAASNLGSMAALVGYPVVVEPNLTLGQQGRAWAAGFAVLALMIVVCGLAVRSAPGAGGPGGPPPAPVSGLTRLRWVALAFVPSSLLLGVTAHITTDIAPIPLLWVIPLALYLLSFVIVFLNPPGWVRAVFAWGAPGALLLLAAQPGRWAELGLHLFFFFSAAMVLHGELARLRPPPARLTEYYLCMSAGGALGGVANALLAPLVLNGFYEYPATVVLACLLMPSPWPAGRRGVDWRDLAWPAALGLIAGVVYFQAQSADYQWVAAAACGLFVRRPVRLGLGVAALLVAAGTYAASRENVIYQSRNFFGVLKVVDIPDTKVHRLVHGTTTHGIQQIHEIRSVRRLPRAYFDPTGPIGQVFMLDKSGRYPPVAVVGLGAGSLATYAETGQEFTFFEIDPAVVRVAEDPQYFTFLSESRARVRVVLGDARLTLAREPARHYGVIVVDAFTSDAIPVHLLTVEAVDVYLDKLADDGLVAFHISNNYVDIEPVLDGAARARGLAGLVRDDTNLTAQEKRRGKFMSKWVLLARTPAAFRWVTTAPGWKPLPGSAARPVWTDDYSDVIGALRLGK